MNPILIGLGIALAISAAGNLWLFDSRDDALQANGQLQTALEGAQETGKLCSRSVASLDEQAKLAAAKAVLDIAAAREASKGKQTSGQATLSKPRSVPTDECKSVESLLDDWYKNRGAK